VLLSIALHDWAMEVMAGRDGAERLGAMGPILLAAAVAVPLMAVCNVALAGSIARSLRERLVLWCLPWLVLHMRLCSPLAWPLLRMDPFLLRLLGESPQTSDLSEEVLTVLDDRDIDREVDPAQRDMLAGVFNLGDITTSEIMTPRTRVKSLDVDTPPERLAAAMVELGHSRVPVYGDHFDNILGVLYAKDLLRELGPDGQLRQGTHGLRALLRPAVFVPESKNVKELLSEMRARKVHIAVVIDEYGGTAGVVTIEDVLEQIVGDIHDEHEQGESVPAVQQLGPGHWRVDAAVAVADLEHEFQLEFPVERDYDTLAGFMLARLGHIPVPGERVEWQGHAWVVREAAPNRVIAVELQVLGEGQTSL
jgi:CBS domain containing-hemolysin-like protein